VVVGGMWDTNTVVVVQTQLVRERPVQHTTHTHTHLIDKSADIDGRSPMVGTPNELVVSALL
jgi:hypothetical protein